MTKAALAFEHEDTPDPSDEAFSIGTVTGIVQKSEKRKGLSFDLYDADMDMIIQCRLKPGQEKIIRKAWGRHARVAGTVSREVGSGRPIAVRDILKIELLEGKPPGSYRLAKGAVPWKPGDMPPEEAVRRVRDSYG